MKLITDRKRENVSRLGELSRKNWDSMTEYERADWSGDLLTASIYGYQGGVNLIPPIGTGVKFRDGAIIAEASGSIVIGDAADFVGKDMTLSAEYVSSGGELSLKWSDGYPAGITLSGAGYLWGTPLGGNGAQLVLNVKPGYYGKVMLELGRTRHDYVPYTEILATDATKGAYNFSDLNRVERAVEEIAEMLGIRVVTKTNWSRWDIPETADLARYLGNIRLIQEVCGENTALPDDLKKMTYSTANAIESVLLRCRNIAEASARCSEVFCGEVN